LQLLNQPSKYVSNLWGPNVLRLPVLNVTQTLESWQLYNPPAYFHPTHVMLSAPFKGLTIAELDVRTLDDALETETYGTVISEALNAGITEISFWGFTNKQAYTWVPGAKPLMLDQCYKPKREFYATHTALTKFVSRS
jgi:hypothetical protein